MSPLARFSMFDVVDDDVAADGDGDDCFGLS